MVRARYNTYVRTNRNTVVRVPVLLAPLKIISARTRAHSTLPSPLVATSVLYTYLHIRAGALLIPPLWFTDYIDPCDRTPVDLLLSVLDRALLRLRGVASFYSCRVRRARRTMFFWLQFLPLVTLLAPAHTNVPLSSSPPFTVGCASGAYYFS